MIIEVKEFLSKSDCDQIISLFIRTSRFTPTDNPFYKNRTLSYQFIENYELKKLIARYRVDTVCKAREIYNKKLYIDYTDIVKWYEGMFMDLHADNAYITGESNNFPFREISCVLYLNDNYDGGNTYFNKQSVSIIPEVGKIVFFPSGLDYAHGVSKIVKGTRFTLSTWMTSDSKQIDV